MQPNIKITKEGKVWRWEIRAGRKVVAGGYCGTKRDAVNDARRVSSVNSKDEPRTE